MTLGNIYTSNIAQTFTPQIQYSSNSLETNYKFQCENINLLVILTQDLHY